MGPQPPTSAARAQETGSSAGRAASDGQRRDLDALSAATLAVEAVAEERAVKRDLLALAAPRCSRRRRSSRPPPRRSASRSSPRPAASRRASSACTSSTRSSACRWSSSASPTRRRRRHRDRAPPPSARRSARPRSRCRTSRASSSTGCCSPTCSTRCGCSSAPAWSRTQVDACMKLGASHPMGPLELLDLVGIDVAEAIGEALHADTGGPVAPAARADQGSWCGRAPGPEVRRGLLRLRAEPRVTPSAGERLLAA